MGTTNWPSLLSMNALADGTAGSAGEPATGLKDRLFNRDSERPGNLLPPQADAWDWLNPAIGWGMILKDDLERSAKSKAAGEGTDEQLLRLLEKRSGVLLYYDPTHLGGSLNRYYPDGSQEKADLTSAPGIDRGQIPRFLMIATGPKEIPWALQFQLATGFFVGRLPLKGQALKNYVDAAVEDWQNCGTNSLNSVIWSVDHGPKDITRLMRETIAEPLASSLGTDTDLAPRLVHIGKSGARALGSDLYSALADKRPGLVVTTSHGATSPLSNPDKLAARLGIPVDASFSRLNFTSEGEDWMPAGAVWYAHACASAGSNGPSSFLDVVKPDSQNHKVLTELGKLPESVAPFPLTLLGCSKPLRAFIGHVEPTFDLSLENQDTGRKLTDSISETFYTQLYRGRPIGFALMEMHRTRNLLAVAETSLKKRFAKGHNVEAEILSAQLAATDWGSIALLGDPAAALQLT